MYAIFNLLSTAITTTLSCIGLATLLNKAGKFFKIIEENKQDGFKKAFDGLALDSIEEINRCVESFSLISNNINKIIIIFYDIITGNKIIKKDKNGKLIICGKSKIFSGFKDKIDELNNKVKKYKEELCKIKKEKKKPEDNSIEIDNNSEKSSNSDSTNSDSTNSDNNSNKDNNTYSDISSDEEDNDDFYLETKK